MNKEPKPLDFEGDPGSGRSTWIAAGISLAALLWMGSGFIFPSEDNSDTGKVETAPGPMSVATRVSHAEDVTLYFRGEGQAEPDRETVIRAETSGEVAEVLAEKGSDVEAGQILARLTTIRLQSDLRRAEEEFDRAKRAFDNAEELLERGVATVDRVVQARATLATARAQRTTAEEALDAARIEAPFDGRLEKFNIDPGEYIPAGSDVGRIVDNRPLTVSLQVPQQMLASLRNADTAHISFITGQQSEGRVAFVGSSAATETRTFLAEIVVPNEAGEIPAGISADIRIATGRERAHFVAPSIVSLNEAGEIGVKTVAEGKVEFHKIEIARAEVNGLWVTGLPDTVEMITIGQGYVRNGEPVRPRPEPGSEPAPDPADVGQ